MRATLEFDLPSDEVPLELASRAIDLYSALSEIRESIRTRLKHSENLSLAEMEYLERLRELIPHDLLDRVV